MPLKDDKILQVWNTISSDIKQLVAEVVKSRRAYYERLVRDLHEQMQGDAVRYTRLLSDGDLTKDDYELLMQSRFAQLKIELLAEASISKSKFDEIAGKVLRIGMTALLALI
jgi:hypothetical protein